MLLARRVQTSFGWIMESADRTPRIIDVPRRVELDVSACTTRPEGRRALADLVGLGDSGLPNVQEEVLRALARGTLVYESWSGFRSRGGGTGEPVDLAELIGEEDEVVPMHSVVIELVGEDDEPIPHVAYRLLGPDGRTRRGRLDDEGRAEVYDIGEAGTCKVCFPDFDEEAWEYVSAVPL
ncbi:MAG: hypothetical protein KUG77_09435 [Nannocystaceae bacterium]|nr:hypothetical protein [Nannocystaceae bacterium]